MFYENMPLYPGMKPAGPPDGCMRVRLFDDGCGNPHCGNPHYGNPHCGNPHCPPAMRECERVTIENPCRRGERAEVVLGVDDCGNLVICVHRACRERRGPCAPWPHRDRCRVPCRKPSRGCGPVWG